MYRFVTALLAGAAICAGQPVPTRAVNENQGYEIRQRSEQAVADQLQQDPNNVALLTKLGGMKAEDGALDDAQSSYERVLAIAPDNTTALYNLGVIGWRRVFAELRTARRQLAMEPETPGPLRDRNIRGVLSAKYGRTVSDSISDLARVLNIEPGNSDAMAYLNLLFRAKADLDDTAAEYSQDIATADEWVQKTLEAVKARRSAVFAAGPPPPPPPPPPAPMATPGRIRVGSNVQAANLISKVDPVYPPLARQARIQGVVRFNAVIAKDGTIANLQVISGHPMLVQSAVEAVKKWLYNPTLLNGEPVEVITTIDVDFALQ